MRNKTNCFSIEKFSENDSAIKFYTGLPDYASFIALFNFVKAEDGYQLNYHNNKKDNEPKSASVSNRGRPRSLSDMNELFLAPTRLRPDLLEEDLGPVHVIPGQLTDPGVNFASVHGLTPVTVHMSFSLPRDNFERRVTRCTTPGNPSCRGNFSPCEQNAKVAPGQE